MSTFRSKLTEQEWLELRGLWESDPQMTFRQLSESELINGRVTASAISKRAKREKWLKRHDFRTGRPSKYRPEFDRQAHLFCLMGATDKLLAELFYVSESTINEWKKRYASFSESVRKGKMIADAEVAHALYQRAVGYSHEAVHFAVVDGEVVQTTYTKHYPPESWAAAWWLKNRQPHLWKDKVEVKEEVNVNVFPSKEKLDAIYEKALKEAEEIEERIVKGRAERLGINLAEFLSGGDDEPICSAS